MAGASDERSAYAALAEAIEAHEREITSAEVGRYLASLDADPAIEART